MKFRLFLFLLCLACGGLQAKFQLKDAVIVSHAAFLNPGEGPYVEVYLNIHGSSIQYQQLGLRQYEGEVAISLIMRRGEEVMDYKKYRLKSPTARDTSKIDFALMDQQRLAATSGKAILEVLVEDLLDSSNVAEQMFELDLDFSNMPCFSGVELLEESNPRAPEGSPFAKNGMELIPYALNFYPSDRNVLKFYAELYGTDEIMPGEKLMITASIRKSGSDEVNPNFWTYFKREAAPVLPTLAEFDLGNLPTGNYDLVLEMRNRENEVIQEQRMFFQRLNNQAVENFENIAMMDISSSWAERYSAAQLDAFVEYLKPACDPTEQNIIYSIENSRDSTMKARFLMNYWLKRSPEKPYDAWLAYLGRVKKANDLFSTTSKAGYRTDRGRVLLQYNEPSDIQARPNEPNAYPYEIWHYYALEDGQNNIRFIFFDPSLVSNDYQLIHSNAVGELRDPRWELRIYQNSADPGLLGDFDETSPGSFYGGNAGSLEDDFGGSILQDRP
jgi:GWxTD domain-containing protein